MSTSTMTPAQAPAQAPAETPEPASEPQAAPQADPGNGSAPEAQSDERDESGHFLSREAAGYRRRLRETETERDQLREQLDRLQTAEAERLAAGAGLSVPGDLWTVGGAELASLRAEDGSVNADAVSGLVEAIVKDRPGLRAPRNGNIGIGLGAAARPPQSPPVGLSALLKP